MDKLQSHLQKMEETSPSPSLLAEPPTVKDRLEVYVNSLFRTIKHIPSNDLVHSVNLDYSSTQPSALTREDEISKYSDLVDARRKLMDLMYGSHKGKGYEINNAYNFLKQEWSKHGYSLTESGELFKRVKSRRGERSQMVLEEQLTSANAGDFNYNEYCRISKIVSRTDLDRILDQYIASDNKASVADVPNGTFIAHMLPVGGELSLLNNDVLSHDARRQGQLFFGNNALTKLPSLSCVAFNSDESIDTRYNRYLGILIGEATIHDAYGGDCGSKPVREDIRLAGGLFMMGNVKEKLSKALRDESCRYREIIIGHNWKPKGIFYESGYASQEQIKIARSLGENHALPVFEFIEGKGFREL